MAYVLVKYFHIIGILVLASMLVLEHALLKRELSPAQLRKIAFYDQIYGISAVVVLTAGLSLWLLVGKDSGFYSANPVFLVKVGLFVLAGLCSIYPTIFFVKSRRSDTDVIEVPKMVIHLLRMELLLLIIIPLLAVFMAQGYGLK